MGAHLRIERLRQTLSSEAAQQQSGDSSPLGSNFATQLRLADEIADVRFANAKDVAIHDRLVKEIENYSPGSGTDCRRESSDWKTRIVSSVKSG